MERQPVKKETRMEKERIPLQEYYRRKKRFFAVFLIASALFVAGFALSLILGGGADAWRGTEGDGTEVRSDRPVSAEPSGTEESSPSDTGESPPTVDSTAEGSAEEPHGETPILSLTLPSCVSGGTVNNESVHSVDLSSLRKMTVSHAVGEEPLVLILHTHTTEGYAPNGAETLCGALGEVTYTRDATRSVLAVGEVLCDTLQAAGIPTIHCKTIHDTDGLRGSYEGAAESIRFFLSHYPSIVYVIDLHRDAVLWDDGSYVRSVAAGEEGDMAQVMAVVGSDGNGTPHPGWERNLALAEQLRASLEKECAQLCRPTILRNASYNQELAPFSLLLEIGTGGNSVEEAKRSAVLVGRSLSGLIRGTQEGGR